MKRLISIAILLASLPLMLWAEEVAPATYTPLVGLPGVDPAEQTFDSFINALYALSIAIAALLAVIKIIIAGVKWMLTDVVTSKQEAKKDIKGALIGLLLVLSAVIILTLINPDLVNVNFNPERIEQVEYVPVKVVGNEVDALSQGDRILLDVSEEECTGDWTGEYCILRGVGSFVGQSVDYNAWDGLPGTDRIRLMTGEIIIGGLYGEGGELPMGAWTDGYYDDTGARDLCLAGGSGNSIRFYHDDVVVTKIRTCSGKNGGTAGVDNGNYLPEIWISTTPGDRATQVGNCYSKSGGIVGTLTWSQRTTSSCYLEDNQIYYVNLSPASCNEDCWVGGANIR